MIRSTNHLKMDLCFLVIVLLWTTGRVDSLECYTCSEVSNINSCLTTTQCQVGQSCFTDSVSSGQSTHFNLGCTSNVQCGVQSSIVGRGIKERETQCHECCSTERCNNQLCIHFKPTTCIDDPKVDCAYLNAMFNICKDIQHSKTVCPKFCGLCTLVDGNWAEWSQWSACSVTCEKGTQTRKRTCTNPAPANKGLDCVGNNTDVKECVKQPCPIHGGWTRWSGWGQCSVSCDLGVQKRNRTCTNPYPSRFGDHCFGESMEDRLCMTMPCANGGWSAWSSWTNCSAICDGGLRHRSRGCTNPVPSPQGKFCDGESLQVEECRGHACVSDVVFSANTLNVVTSTANRRLIFTNVLVNRGGGYNSATGVFTAPVNGSYSFSTQFCLYTGVHVYINIMVNNAIYSASHYYEANTYVCNVGKIYAYLKKGDTVWVKSTASTSSGNNFYQNSDHMNLFSGVLIRN